MGNASPFFFSTFFPRFPLIARSFGGAGLVGVDVFVAGLGLGFWFGCFVGAVLCATVVPLTVSPLFFCLARRRSHYGIILGRDTGVLHSFKEIGACPGTLSLKEN